MGHDLSPVPCLVIDCNPSPETPMDQTCGETVLKLIKATLLPSGDQDKLAARIAGSVLKVYPGVAHLVLWEVPEQVAEDATAFFRSLADALSPTETW